MGRRNAKPVTDYDCTNCKSRSATHWFNNSGIAAHGFEEPWCEVCVLEKQIPFARQSAERLSGLEMRYVELTGMAFGDDHGD